MTISQDDNNKAAKKTTIAQIKFMINKWDINAHCAHLTAVSPH